MEPALFPVEEALVLVAVPEPEPVALAVAVPEDPLPPETPHQCENLKNLDAPGRELTKQHRYRLSLQKQFQSLSLMRRRW